MIHSPAGGLAGWRALGWRGWLRRCAVGLGALALIGAGAWRTPARGEDVPESAPPPLPPDAAPAPAQPAPAEAPPAQLPPIHAFEAWRGQMRAGTPVRAPGLLLVPLLRSAEHQELVGDARVGLHEAVVDVMDLPSPAGNLYVRMTNRSHLPVEVTAGEALSTPHGGARVVSRSAYLPPGGSAPVPTLPMPAAITGPYIKRGLGLTPREQELTTSLQRWLPEVEARNAQMGVDALRMSDATAAYLTDVFVVHAAPYEPRFAALRVPECVGVAVFDERGLSFARVCADAPRWRDNLVFLERELILDALRGQAAQRAVVDRGDPALRADALQLFDVLRQAGVARAWYAGAALHRWDVPARNGRWDGLSVEGQPWSLTFRVAPPPVPRPGQPGGAPQPPPPPPPDDPPTTPGQTDRKVRPTIEEERQRERREGGGGTPGGGGSGGGGGGGGGLGGGGLGGGLR